MGFSQFVGGTEFRALMLAVPSLAVQFTSFETFYGRDVVR
jgi:hypothetical protein